MNQTSKVARGVIGVTIISAIIVGGIGFILGGIYVGLASALITFPIALSHALVVVVNKW